MAVTAKALQVSNQANTDLIAVIEKYKASPNQYKDEMETKSKAAKNANNEFKVAQDAQEELGVQLKAAQDAQAELEAKLKAEIKDAQVAKVEIPAKLKAAQDVVAAAAQAVREAQANLDYVARSVCLGTSYELVGGAERVRNPIDLKIPCTGKMRRMTNYHSIRL